MVSPTTGIYTLSLHDALPIYRQGRAGHRTGRAGVVQRACARTAVAVLGCRVDEATKAAGGKSRRLEPGTAGACSCRSPAKRLDVVVLVFQLSGAGRMFQEFRTSGRGPDESQGGRKQPCIAAALMIAPA